MKRRLMSSEVDCNGEMLSKVELVERNDSPLGVQLVNPSAVRKMAPSDLVRLALEITKAEEFVKANASSKLSLIADQMRFLHRQAIEILTDAKQSNELHRAGCNFQKIPGRIYFLYQRPSGQKYFSLLSIDDWKGSPPHEYLGAYRLETDMSWTPENKFDQKSDNLALLDKLMMDCGDEAIELMMLEN